ncbi:C-type lectin domain family 4 member E-like isoform X3 [Oreochromis niloticus]|uniref:C-type lectin domain family 4 member E-like isoform X3 n=1 Tax=Oreochromis niloticus TaxID=8128 RepID=UPI000DF129C6|nr:C-type lectin domain family 4 member E-like isoform X3 [Oreochromis niloticus]
MEEIYVNERCFKPANKSSIKNLTGPRSCKRNFYLVVILLLGLLTGSISLAFYYKNALHKYLSSSKQLSSMTEERDLLKANLTEMTKELERLQRLFNQKKTCPAGWSKFCCSCYLLSESSDSWHSARKNCTDQGADLVVIDSPEEQKRTWIGLNDIEQEGTWKWVDGTPLTLKYWASGQPDNAFPKENCAHIRFYENTSWNDFPCQNSLQWVCEKLL